MRPCASQFCSSLWRLLTLLAPPLCFSSATEGLMTATQWSHSLAAAAPPEEAVDGARAASTFCPCCGLDARPRAAACERAEDFS